MFMCGVMYSDCIKPHSNLMTGIETQPTGKLTVIMFSKLTCNDLEL
jgi:hypothetical protein